MATVCSVRQISVSALCDGTGKGQPCGQDHHAGVGDQVVIADEDRGDEGQGQ